MKAFRKIVTSDLDTMKLQNAIEQVLNPLAKVPILDGVTLTNLHITTSAQKFDHNLSRQPQGWFLVDLADSATVFRTDWTATTISLQASANCTASLWVF